MKLILDTHKKILQDLIGQSIHYGLIPNLIISSSEVYPESTFYHQDYGHFYSSYELNLRVKDATDIKQWITFSPGPDEAIEEWAPFWITNPVIPDFNHIIKDTRFFDKQNTQDLIKGNTVIELENNFLDTHGDGLGMVRCSFWSNNDPIKSIAVFEYDPYAACIITHESGMEWCMYAEYDFIFWINFSQKMIANIKAENESVIIIK